MERWYQVHVLVGDGKPGWIPFTYNVTATDRDEAIKRVRRSIRSRSRGRSTVHHIQSARLLHPGNPRRIH